jgi:8-oxo-dGTP pyrophosphatase MutT (NUDIX family)
MNDINEETSVGAIIYKKSRNNILFLLVYSKRNREWGFAKGHIEQSETEIQTAKREIEEETGISDIIFIEKFRETDSYRIKGTLMSTKNRIITKKVVYYLCCANEEFKRISDEEIGMCEWLSYSRAFDLLKYKKQKEILSKANKFIKEECNESCIKR